MGSSISRQQEDVAQLLGEGSFGRVWKIRNPDKDQRRENPFAALKVIKAPDSSAQDEVELMKTMEHRNIIKFINSFMHEGRLNIVMEYCDLGTFTDLFRKHKTDRAEFSIWRMISHIASALAYLHGKHILHRDLKPDNILGKTTDPKHFKLVVCDFGVAKLLNRKAQEMYYTCHAAGTPIYMAPEVLMGAGERYTWSSDIWSLGIRLYS